MSWLLHLDIDRLFRPGRAYGRELDPVLSYSPTLLFVRLRASVLNRPYP